MKSKLELVYVTCANQTQAVRIGRVLVKERLAACANVLGPIRSVFRWRGKVCEGPEVALILKTRRTLRAKLVARVRALHSYECPCVVAVPIMGGNLEFLKWISSETQ